MEGLKWAAVAVLDQCCQMFSFTKKNIKARNEYFCVKSPRIGNQSDSNFKHELAN